MTNGGDIVNQVAPITNVLLMAQLVDRCMNRRYGLPGMGTFYGFSGYGKTFATTFAANRYDAVYVEVKSSWGAKFLCQKIAIECGLDTKGTIAGLVERIGEQLALSGKPLLIDEADHLVRKRMIEVVRDIHMTSHAAVILIGEERLPGKLEQWERIHGRMLDWVAAQPVSESDARHLAKLYCPDVEIDDALFAEMLDKSVASARRITVNLNMIYELARTKQLDRVTLGDWAGREFPTGRAPQARRVA